jgi:hypothetical protein
MKRSMGILVLLIMAGLPAWSQQVTAAIAGRITDSSGAVIANAKMTATDIERGSVFTTVSNSEGLYELPRVPVGSYTVKAESAGFQSAQQSNVLLVLNQTARLDFHLQVGNSSQSVEVTSAAPLLQTESTQTNTVIDARTNAALPLATRNYVQLTLLAAGSVTTNPSEFTGPESSYNGGRPYINGNREQGNNFLLDGVNNNQVSENAVGYTPSVDAIEEFNMITQNASAEFGQFMGGIINVSIKSGTNQFHGSAFEFLRNDQLNANQWQNNWNDIKRAPLRWNEFGVAIGGPILRDKLFFFADYQGSRFDQAATTSAYSVLTTAERTGNFSQLLSQNVQLHYPGTTTPIPGNILPVNLLSPQAVAVVSPANYPVPVNNELSRNALNTTRSYTNQDQGDMKIDWNASSKDHLYGRYSRGNVENPTLNSVPLLYNTEELYISHNAVIDYTRTVSPTVVNDVRFGVNYLPYLSGAVIGGGVNPGSIGIPGAPSAYLPGFSFSAGNLQGGSFGGPGSSLFADTVWQVGDTAIISRGKHTLHAGVQLFRSWVNSHLQQSGSFSFSGQYTGAAEADFMTGVPTGVIGGNLGGTWGQRSSLIAAFIQDDWHVTPTLTLNLGLRYELNTPWVEVANRQANFDLISGKEYIAGDSGCPYTNCRALYNSYNGPTNFQPRVGLSWNPGGKRLVIRASFTNSGFLEGTGTNVRLPLNPPFGAQQDVQYKATQTPSTLAQGFTIFEGSPLNPATEFVGASLRLWDPDVRPAVVNQWSATIQYQLSHSATLQVGYVGQRNTHLMVPIIASESILQPDGTHIPSFYLSGNPILRDEIGLAKITASTAPQDYAGLQVVLQKRLSNGLELQANYTWSKCMTNDRGFYGQLGDGGQAAVQGHWQNSYDAAADWGPCYYNVTHAFNGFVSYDLPFGKGRAFGNNLNKAVDAVVGNWQVNTVLNFRGGFPLTIANYNDSSQTGSRDPRANCIAPPEVFGELSSPTGGYQWFNPNSYAAPTLGTFGNCGVGTVVGPGLHTADLGLSKRFNIRERYNLEFRAEAINLTNTPILNAPNNTVPGPVVSTGNFGTGQFGQITSAQGARNIQFALKLHF